MRVREVTVRSTLSRSRLFDYCVNPYAGCANGCVYCYARFATRFSHPSEEWGTFVDVRSNAADVLRRELARARRGTVYMSSVCDAWQAPEAEYRISRECLSLLLASGLSIVLQTKNALVERDLDLLQGRQDVQFGVTVTSVDEAVSRVFEPGASSSVERLRVLARARDMGLPVFVFLGPLLPGISDRGEGLQRLMEAMARVRPGYLLVDRLNRRAGMWPAVMKAVCSVDATLLDEYRRVLFSMEQAAYEAELRERIVRAAADFDLQGLIRWCF